MFEIIHSKKVLFLIKASYDYYQYWFKSAHIKNKLIVTYGALVKMTPFYAFFKLCYVLELCDKIKQDLVKSTTIHHDVKVSWISYKYSAKMANCSFRLIIQMNWLFFST